VLARLDSELSLKVIGGYTGSGKSVILNDLHSKGEQVIDLEKLANHRGSAFGAIGLGEQPTQEQFENELASAMTRLDLSRVTWIEDESRMTGRLKMPDRLYEQIRNAPVYFVDKNFEERARYILDTYGKFDTGLLLASTQKLKKRLGDLRMRQAVAHLENGEMYEWVAIVLAYYDKTYAYGLSSRDPSAITYVTSEMLPV
jgi:tRNA 2-selenouridine synthase